MVGPVLAEPEGQPLPPELAAFLDRGMPEHRAIYISMVRLFVGMAVRLRSLSLSAHLTSTNMQGTLGALLEPELRSLASALSGLPNPVLLKLGNNDMPGELDMSAWEQKDSLAA